ncbi:MAG: site-specific DNA-methyltransferase [Planctomycetota bacterium]
MFETDYIYDGDTVEFMRTLPDECSHLIIADPPYNIDKDFGPGTFFTDHETWIMWSRQWLVEAKRLLHKDGNLFVYALHHNACYLQCLLYELGLVYRRQIIWFYENGWSKYKNSPACHYEPLIWFSKSPNSIYHTIREPYKSKERLKHKITKNGKIWTPNPEGRQGGDVWHIPTLAGRRFANERVEHPTQKPLAISQRIVRHFSNVGDLVFVPFVGSGSECVAAVQLGRTYLGAEINREYAEIARQRICDVASLKTEVAL